MIGEFLIASDVCDASRFVNKQCRFYNCYGHTECSGTTLQHLISSQREERGILPIGRPIVNVRIYLVDEYLQLTIPGVQTGEVIIGGNVSFHYKQSFLSPFIQKERYRSIVYIFIDCGLFSGYCNTEDTANITLCNFNGEICYRTGDLAWFNTTNGQLEFRGCRDDQLKLKCHSNDFEDVKSALKEMVTDCFIVKAKLIDIDYLAAYVQTTYTVQQLREHCCARLPPYLVPSVFMIVDNLHVDQSEQINLPLPDWTTLSVVSNMKKQPRSDMEERVRQIWYQSLPHIYSIPSIWTSFFVLGDDPGSFIRLLHLYSNNFTHTLPITTFLEQPTIAQHTRLLIEHSSIELSSVRRLQSIDTIEGMCEKQLRSRHYSLKKETEKDLLKRHRK